MESAGEDSEYWRADARVSLRHDLARISGGAVCVRAILVAPQADTVIRWRRIVGVVLLLGLLAEGASQLVVFLCVGERYRTFAPYVWSPYGVVRNNPRLTSPQFKIDASGFRALRDYSREKPKRTLRVMMLGGSVLYSGLGGVPQEGVERVG